MDHRDWLRLHVTVQIAVDSNCSHEIKTLAPWKKSYDEPRESVKKQRHYFVYKGPYS